MWFIVLEAVQFSPSGLLSVAWGVKLSQIHTVCLWSVTLTHVLVSMACARGAETLICGKGSPAGSAAEALGVVAGRGSWCVC